MYVYKEYIGTMRNCENNFAILESDFRRNFGLLLARSVRAWGESSK